MTFGILFTIIISAVTYMQTAEQFGAPPNGDDLRRMERSPNFHGGRFRNIGNVEMEMGVSNGFSALYEFVTARNTRPGQPLPTDFPATWNTIALLPSEFAVTWFGHSAIMLEMEGKRLLIDPMLGPAASPVPIFGKRFLLDQDIDLGTIPPVHAVLISHDHYDHLDHTSILALSDRVGHFYVPLGVGSHLRRWGIAAHRISEMDWWDEVTIEGIRVTAAPAQHFSGRSFNDRNQTLWASWVIRGEHSSMYFSGDSGYGPHFREIGERFGPFDFTMMECGQYNEKWQAIHALPEESVQGHLDLQGNVMMPIHWGGFTLAPHEWTDPVQRVRAAAREHDVTLVTPRIGQRMLPRHERPMAEWWKI